MHNWDLSGAAGGGGVKYSKKTDPDADHQVVVKITEMTVPESPPRRDSHPLLVIFPKSRQIIECLLFVVAVVQRLF